MIAEWGLERRAGGSRCAIGPYRRGEPVTADRLSAPNAAQWHVLQTRSRQEKVVAELLRDGGAQPFLPVVRRIMHYGHRRRTVELPLFSSYVFVWGTLEHSYHAIASRRAVRAVPVRDQATLTRELEQIRRAIRGDAALSPYRFLLRGVRVRVTSGPFKDIEGLVEAGERNGRLVLQIDTLGRAASMQIDACLLERIDVQSGPA